MKITGLQAGQPATPGSPPDWRTQLGQIVVRVETDEGTSGIGVGGGGAAGSHVVQTVLSELLVGRDPSEVETLHADMLRHTSFYGRKGIVVMAISGVDLALWDLRGKLAGRTVARLLNDEVDVERELPTYGTVWDEDLAEQAWRSGQQAIKLHVEGCGNHVESLVQLIGEVRRRLGSSVSLMLDAFASWDVPTTLRVADAIAPHDIAWLEEPIPPDDLQGYETLAQRCPIPIAGGEHEYTTDGFRTLIERGLHSIVQPDINWCGGMTTMIDIYEMAQHRGVRVCPHRGCEPFALHAIAALDSQPLAESARTWFTCLDGAPKIHQGRIRLQRGTGFGVSLGRFASDTLEW